MYLDLLLEQCEKNNIKSGVGFHDFLRQKGFIVNYKTAVSYYNGRGVSCVILAEIFKCFGKELKFVI